ncbi:MAG: tetratricopeptide repeat protein [Desulfosudis oleivorans]|nr:tetratricopeptide repeat protein [Desulfosudis oleivorans]
MSDNAAVLALVAQARIDTGEARYSGAVAGIERALRIEPRNARLWQELARVRLAQGDPEQAENLARRANTYCRRRPASAGGQLAPDRRGPRRTRRQHRRDRGGCPCRAASADNEILNRQGRQGPESICRSDRQMVRTGFLLALRETTAGMPVRTTC